MGINYTPRTWVAGEVVTAAEFNAEVRDALSGIQAAFDTYTPTLTASTTNPTLGTGNTSFGRYIQLGKIVICVGQIFNGTTGWAAGSGTYRFSLPVTANTSGATSKRIGIATAAGTSGGTGGFAYLGGSTFLQLFYYAAIPGTGASLSATAPAAQVASTTYDWCVMYEAA